MPNDLEILEQARTPQPAPAASPEPQAPADDVIFEDLPADVQQLPVVKMLAIGNPPAVRIEPGQYFPDFEPIGRNLPKVLEGGLDFYKAQSGDGILFNPIFITDAELTKADESGKLAQIVPSYGELMGVDPVPIPDDKFESLLKQQEDNQIALRQLSAEDAQPQIEEPPAAVEQKIGQARVKNIAPQEPTEGQAPGAGQILRGLMKRAV